MYDEEIADFGVIFPHYSSLLDGIMICVSGRLERVVKLVFERKSLSRPSNEVTFTCLNYGSQVVSEELLIRHRVEAKTFVLKTAVKCLGLVPTRGEYEQ